VPKSIQYFTIILGLALLGCNSKKTVQGSYPTQDLNKANHPSKQQSKEVTISGTVVSDAAGSCGTICMGGLLCVKVIKQPQQFNRDSILIATACEEPFAEGDTIEATVILMTGKEDECFYKHVNGRLNQAVTDLYKTQTRIRRLSGSPK
jgi:hypothetical protein